MKELAFKMQKDFLAELKIPIRLMKITDAPHAYSSSYGIGDSVTVQAYIDKHSTHPRTPRT